MKCTHPDHKKARCHSHGTLVGHVPLEHVSLMLEDKKKMLETLELIKALFPKARRSRTSNGTAQKAGKLSSSQKDAHPAPVRVETTPQGRSQKTKPDAISEDTVKICIKVWLEVRVSTPVPE
jgi:hypothetical protein